MSGARVAFPPGTTFERCYVALVDPQVEAEWGHDAKRAFVPAEGDGEVVLRDTSFPEYAKGAVRLFRVPFP
jgi:hypothetical protein